MEYDLRLLRIFTPTIEYRGFAAAEKASSSTRTSPSVDISNRQTAMMRIALEVAFQSQKVANCFIERGSHYLIHEI